MKIVSKIKRRNGHTVTLGDTAYKFLPPDYAAEVTDKAHVERFLSIPEGYGIADGEVSTKAEQNSEPKRVESVEYVGSDVHPASFEIGGKTIEQSVVVAMAAGERKPEEWNALSEGERADLIDEQLDKLAESTEDGDTATEGATDDHLEGDLNGDGNLDREELAKLYEAKFGKRPHGKWNAARISEELKKDAE